MKDKLTTPTPEQYQYIHSQSATGRLAVLKGTGKKPVTMQQAQAYVEAWQQHLRTRGVLTNHGVTRHPPGN